MALRAVGAANPLQFQRAMVFIDGTNLFCRLQAARLKLLSCEVLASVCCEGRQLLRTYLYTVEQNMTKAKTLHGGKAFDNVRIVLGDGIATGDGNIKEKGVDALLVADLVYHAASKNYDLAVLVSVDTDFTHAMERVADFGCVTAVVGVCADVPDRLKSACDKTLQLSREVLLNWHCVEVAEPTRSS